eukprot:CAMPEP_0116144556 /NCGR_PEP_ID=MMETSP0329-20121206/16072_1 /TAXON_ID=697910 /ORGANISM="Pseudo-nitzschia arenysensis, Strain B593" /LENGTH=203 /DNA_ID=CAMNT_0003640001 /DNA_START=255 /DNA_END=866 /DNA_ORIENTATION=+
MIRTARQALIVLAAILACAILVLAGGADAFRTQQSPAILTQQHSRLVAAESGLDLVNLIRGGAVDVDIESSDEEESDEEEEEDAPSLAKSAKKAATKAVKKSVAAAMTPKKKKKSFGLGKFFKLPYIVKACLNPLVFLQMTAGYWKSLYNINYMSDNTADASQDLRSALEQKARLAASSKPRGRKKMKPGQAKTLSDLPALNT